MENRFPQKISEEERENIIKYFEVRFGMPPEIFEPYDILKGSSNFWLFPKNFPLNTLSKLQVQTVGLLFLRKVSHYLKPTSAFLQRFGEFATRNIVKLSEEEIKKIREEGKVEKELNIEPGYVILKDKYWILGCGLYLPGKIISYLESKVIRTL